MIIAPILNQPIVEEDKTMSRAFSAWAGSVSDLGVFTGSGSPEGVVNAGITRFYMNTAGTAGSILYVKKLTNISGDASRGWILV